MIVNIKLEKDNSTHQYLRVMKLMKYLKQNLKAQISRWPIVLILEAINYSIDSKIKKAILFIPTI